MNVFYEEEGDFKVGSVLADNDSSLQVEAPHGKRSKVKASAVLLRFDGPGLAHFMDEARKLAEAIDADFLWQCSGQEEFAFDALAREYFGRAPTAAELASLLVKLHSAPMYFYKKGKGRYKPAPPEALKAALASVERKRREAEQRAGYVEQLVAGKLPPEFSPLAAKLLYAPDMHDPELVIRTSGEQRLSNYLLWQSAYSELHFTDVLWPDFAREDFEFALAEFDARRRRFGGR